MYVTMSICDKYVADSRFDQAPGNLFLNLFSLYCFLYFLPGVEALTKLVASCEKQEIEPILEMAISLFRCGDDLAI